MSLGMQGLNDLDYKQYKEEQICKYAHSNFSRFDLCE